MFEEVAGRGDQIQLGQNQDFLARVRTGEFLDLLLDLLEIQRLSRPNIIAGNQNDETIAPLGLFVGPDHLQNLPETLVNKLINGAEGGDQVVVLGRNGDFLLVDVEFDDLVQKPLVGMLDEDVPPDELLEILPELSPKSELDIHFIICCIKKSQWTRISRNSILQKEIPFV